MIWEVEFVISLARMRERALIGGFLDGRWEESTGRLTALNSSRFFFANSEMRLFRFLKM